MRYVTLPRRGLAALVIRAKSLREDRRENLMATRNPCANSGANTEYGIHPTTTSSGRDGSDVDPNGKDVVRVGEGLNRERELDLRVPRLVNTRRLHHLYDAVHVHETGMQWKTWGGGNDVDDSVAKFRVQHIPTRGYSCLDPNVYASRRFSAEPRAIFV